MRQATAQATGLNTDNGVSLGIETVIPFEHGFCYGGSLQFFKLACQGLLYQLGQQGSELWGALKTGVGDNSLQLLANFAVGVRVLGQCHRTVPNLKLQKAVGYTKSVGVAATDIAAISAQFMPFWDQIPGFHSDVTVKSLDGCTIITQYDI